MKKLLTIFFLFSFLFINHCSKNEKIEIVEIEEDQIEGQMIKKYVDVKKKYCIGDNYIYYP